MTGSRGPQSKPDSRRQRRNKPTSQLVLSSPRGAPPAPPTGLLKETVARWDVYWASDVAQAAREAHLPMIERLFARYDERERAYRAVKKKGRLVTGSQGQPVLNPLLKYIDSCDSEIRMLEDRLGLSPRTMAQLGAGFMKTQKSLDDLNRSMDTGDDDDHADVDPREVVGKIG